MVMMNPQLVLWHEAVYMPVNPDKTVHVKNHWRRRPQRPEMVQKNDAEQKSRVVEVEQPNQG